VNGFLTLQGQDAHEAYTERGRPSHCEALQEKLRSCTDGEVASSFKRRAARKGAAWREFGAGL